MLGDALRLIRVFHDRKINQLAKEIGLSASYISEIENGKKTPSLDTIEKYAEYFDTSPGAIMFFAKDIEQDKKKPIRATMRSNFIKFLQHIEEATA